MSKFTKKDRELLDIVDRRIRRSFPSIFTQELKTPVIDTVLNNLDGDIDNAINEAFNDADFYESTEIYEINNNLVGALEETINKRNYFNEESLTETNNALNDALSGKVTFDEQFNKVTITEENGILIVGENEGLDVARINLRGVGVTSDGTNFAGIHIQKNQNPSGTDDWKSMFWADTEGNLFLEGNLQPGSILTGTTEEGVIIDPELGVAVLSEDVRITLNGASNTLGDDSYSGISIQKRINNTGVEEDDWQLNFYADPNGDVFLRGNVQLEDGSILVGDEDDQRVFISNELAAVVTTSGVTRTMLGGNLSNASGLIIQKNEGSIDNPDWKSNFYVDNEGDIFTRGTFNIDGGSILNTILMGNPVTLAIGPEANVPDINEYITFPTIDDQTIVSGSNTSGRFQETGIDWYSSAKPNITTVLLYDVDPSSGDDVSYTEVVKWGKNGIDGAPKRISSNVYRNGLEIQLDEHLLGNTFEYSHVGFQLRVVYSKNIHSQENPDASIAKLYSMTFRQQSSSIALNSDGLYQRIGSDKIIPYGTGGSGGSLTVEGGEFEYAWEDILDKPFITVDDGDNGNLTTENDELALKNDININSINSASADLEDLNVGINEEKTGIIFFQSNSSGLPRLRIRGFGLDDDPAIYTVSSSNQTFDIDNLGDGRFDVNIGGNISASNINDSNWDTAYDRSPTGLGFSGGTLTLDQQVGTETVSLDGRYGRLGEDVNFAGLTATTGTFSGNIDVREVINLNYNGNLNAKLNFNNQGLKYNLSLDPTTDGLYFYNANLTRREVEITADGNLNFVGNLQADSQTVIDSSRNFTGNNATFEGNLEVGGKLESDDFQSHIIDGKGWGIDPNAPNGSYFEIDNLRVRKEFRTHLFVKEAVRATNGRLYVSDASEVAEEKTFTSGSSTLDIKAGLKYATFSIGDTVLIRSVAPDNTSINNVELIVTDVDISDSDVTTLSVNIEQGGTVYEGDTIVRTSGATLLLDADDNSAPYMDAIDDGTLKTRVGNLLSIPNAVGYGLWGQNTFLTGNLLVGDLTKGAGTGASGKYLEYANGDLTGVFGTISFDASSFALTAGDMTIDSLDGIAIDASNYFKQDKTFSFGGGLIEGTGTTLSISGDNASINVSDFTLNATSTDNSVINLGSNNIILNGDGSGQLAGGNIDWTSAGALSLKDTDIEGTLTMLDNSIIEMLTGTTQTVIMSPNQDLPAPNDVIEEYSDGLANHSDTYSSGNTGGLIYEFSVSLGNEEKSIELTFDFDATETTHDGFDFGNHRFYLESASGYNDQWVVIGEYSTGTSGTVQVAYNESTVSLSLALGTEFSEVQDFRLRYSHSWDGDTVFDGVFSNVVVKQYSPITVIQRGGIFTRFTPNIIRTIGSEGGSGSGGGGSSTSVSVEDLTNTEISGRNGGDVLTYDGDGNWINSQQVASINNETGNITLDSTYVNLGNVDNYSRGHYDSRYGVEPTNHRREQIDAHTGNTSDQVWLLCPAERGNNEVIGSLYLQRSSGHYEAFKADIVISTRSGDGGEPSSRAVLRSMKLRGGRDVSLHTCTYGGTDYYALRWRGGSYMISQAFFDGYIRGDGNQLTNLETSEVSNLSSEIISSDAESTYNHNLRVGRHLSIDGNLNVSGSITGISASDVGASPTGHTHNHLMTGTTSNLNSVTTGDQSRVNYHRYSSSASNSPSTTNNANGVLTMMSHGGTYGKQIAFSDNEGIYVRRFSNGNYHSWRTFYHTGNKPSASDVGAVHEDGGTFKGTVTFDSNVTRMAASNNARVEVRSLRVGSGSSFYIEDNGGSRRFRMQGGSGFAIYNRLAIGRTTPHSGFRLEIDSDDYDTHLRLHRSSHGNWSFTPSAVHSGGSGDALRIRYNGSNKVSLGADGNVYADNFVLASDRRLKTEIKDIQSIDSVRSLKPKSFYKRGRFGYGFIAQDVDKILPSIVGKGGDYLSLYQSDIIALNTSAIQYLDKEFIEQKSEVDVLKEKVDKLEKQVLELGGAV